MGNKKETCHSLQRKHYQNEKYLLWLNPSNDLKKPLIGLHEFKLNCVPTNLSVNLRHLLSHEILMVKEPCNLKDFILTYKTLCNKLRSKHLSFFGNQIIFHSTFNFANCPSYITIAQTYLTTKFCKKIVTPHFGSFWPSLVTLVRGGFTATYLVLSHKTHICP